MKFSSSKIKLNFEKKLNQMLTVKTIKNESILNKNPMFRKHRLKRSFVSKKKNRQNPILWDLT